MAYWRMQLHPADPDHAVKYCIESLASGYIGLDFSEDVGDLTHIHQEQLRSSEQDYWLFSHEMRRGDIVLIMAHHFPFALVEVAGGYNYIRRKDKRLGLWFRHFRKIDNARYYADYFTNANEWESIPMTDTISPLRNQNSESYQLIEKWLQS